MKFCWSSLYVKNMEESVKFYTDIVGLAVVREMSAGPDLKMVFLSKGGTEIELMCNGKNEESNIGSDISWGFEVESLDKALELVKAHGIELEGEPFQPAPDIKFFFIKDPNGMKIQLVEKIK